MLLSLSALLVGVLAVKIGNNSGSGKIAFLGGLSIVTGLAIAF